MSKTYPELPGTNFPDQLDSFTRVMDVSAQYKGLATQWAAMIERGNLDEAANLLQAYPELDRMTINAAKINRIGDSVMALERFFLQEIDTYLVNLTSYQGAWRSTTRYTKFNVVTYTVGSNTQAYMAIVADVPLGSVPTNTNYWVPITMRGEKGDKGDKGDTGATGPQGVQGIQGPQGVKGDTGPKGDTGDKGDTGERGPQGIKGLDGLNGADGINFIYVGKWEQGKTYGPNEAVTYDNSLWQTKHDNVTTAPTDDSEDWYLVIRGIDDGTRRILIPTPSQTGELTYNGYEQEPTWANYFAGTCALSGETSATNAGVYNVTFTPQLNCAWEDGTEGAKVISWSIGKKVIPSSELPAQVGELTYNGREQTPTWSNYDSEKFTISGATTATDAGTYTVTFTCTNNYIVEQ